MTTLMKRLVLTSLLLLFPVGASAYIGPGLGLGTIGVVLGIFGAILLGLFAILWFPTKRLFNRLAGRKEEKNSVDPENEEKDSE